VWIDSRKGKFACEHAIRNKKGCGLLPEGGRLTERDRGMAVIDGCNTLSMSSRLWVIDDAGDRLDGLIGMYWARKGWMTVSN